MIHFPNSWGLTCSRFWFIPQRNTEVPLKSHFAAWTSFLAYFCCEASFFLLFWEDQSTELDETTRVVLFLTPGGVSGVILGVSAVIYVMRRSNTLWILGLFIALLLEPGVDDPLDFLLEMLQREDGFGRCISWVPDMQIIKIGNGLDNQDQSDTPNHIATEFTNPQLDHTGATTCPLLSCLLSRIHDFFP